MQKPRPLKSPRGMTLPDSAIAHGVPTDEELAEEIKAELRFHRETPMSYKEFTLEAVVEHFGVTTQEADLFPTLQAAPVPAWLTDSLARGTRLALISEKARSEFIVAPILLAARELCADKFAIFSGQRFDVAPEEGLAGECDFILALSPAVPPLHAPVMTLVEAKKNDIEIGLGQCIAQMIAARRFNEAAGQVDFPIFGCVTTGETWQFLRLADTIALLDKNRYYLDNLTAILGILRMICQEALKARTT
jgi:hypothetical protein